MCQNVGSLTRVGCAADRQAAGGRAGWQAGPSAGGQERERCGRDKRRTNSELDPRPIAANKVQGCVLAERRDPWTTAM